MGGFLSWVSTKSYFSLRKGMNLLYRNPISVAVKKSKGFRLVQLGDFKAYRRELAKIPLSARFFGNHLPSC